MGLSWGIWDAQIFDLHPQILLGADVLYDSNGMGIIIVVFLSFDLQFSKLNSSSNRSV